MFQSSFRIYPLKVKRQFIGLDVRRQMVFIILYLLISIVITSYGSTWDARVRTARCQLLSLPCIMMDRPLFSQSAPVTHVPSRPTPVTGDGRQVDETEGIRETPENRRQWQWTEDLWSRQIKETSIDPSFPPVICHAFYALIQV